jgi:hypothetical protein
MAAADDRRGDDMKLTTRIGRGTPQPADDRPAKLLREARIEHARRNPRWHELDEAALVPRPPPTSSTPTRTRSTSPGAARSTHPAKSRARSPSTRSCTSTSRGPASSCSSSACPAVGPSTSSDESGAGRGHDSARADQAWTPRDNRRAR